MNLPDDTPFLAAEFPSIEELQDAFESLEPVSGYRWSRPGVSGRTNSLSFLDVIELMGPEDRLISFSLLTDKLQGPVVSVLGYTENLGDGDRDWLYGPVTLVLGAGRHRVHRAIEAFALAYEQVWLESSQLIGVCTGMQQLASPLLHYGLAADCFEQDESDPFGLAELFLPRFLGHDTMESVHASEIYRDGSYRIPQYCLTGGLDNQYDDDYIRLVRDEVFNLAVHAGDRNVAAVLLGTREDMSGIPALAPLFSLPQGLTGDQRGAIVYGALCRWEDNKYKGAPEVMSE